MSDEGKPEVGAIGWIDLTVENAEEIRDFYNDVVGWEPTPVDMGDYSDFNMNAPGSGQPMAGVCHARGPNTDLPSQWMLYIVVADMERSLSACSERGGQVIRETRGVGSQGRYAVVQDPAGAVVALFEPAD
jgi:predicted enzyme related to lactoylglutathione lyase